MGEPTALALGSTLERIRERQPILLEREPEPVDEGAGLEAWRAGRWTTIVPSRYVNAELSEVEFTLPNGTKMPPSPPQVLEWAQRPRGRNLVISGTVGVGKTYMAIGAVRALHFRGWEVVFAPIIELLDALRPSGGDPDGALEEACHAEVLVLDDVGSERPTDWTAERFYAVVNRRYMEQRPTVVTTNLGRKELQEAVGERVMSRLVGSGAVTVRLVGPDRRRES